MGQQDALEQLVHEYLQIFFIVMSRSPYLQTHKKKNFKRFYMSISENFTNGIESICWSININMRVGAQAPIFAYLRKINIK